MGDSKVSNLRRGPQVSRGGCDQEFGQLQKLHDACPAIRLLFAGRFDLAGEVPAHAEMFTSALPLPLKAVA